jgi:hypothetical protein
MGAVCEIACENTTGNAGEYPKLKNATQAESEKA